MAPNGEFEENGDVELELGDRNDSCQDKRRRLSGLKSVVSEIMRSQADPDPMESKLELLIDTFVDKEVELALAKQKHLRNEKWDSRSELRPSKSRSLQLQFSNRIRLPVLSGRKILGEQYTSIRVALVDGFTGKVVNSGPEASAKVEIVILEADFNCFGGDNWTLEEFNSKIVREWEGKRPRLSGEVHINLKEGIGFVGDVYFAHTKCWMTKREYRLGARVVDGSLGIGVREAKTDPFIVEDRRGKLYQKHHPPTLLDEVWRLEKIGRGGAFHNRLSKQKVNTVKDFLTQLFLNPTGLRNILGTGISARMWEVTVDHARTCVIDPRLHLYRPPGSQQKTGVVFNVVGQMVGLLSECQYAPLVKLSETQKAEAHKLVIAAFEHWESVISFDDEASLMDGLSHLFNDVLHSNSATVDNSNSSKILTSQKMGGYECPRASACSPCIIPSIYSMGCVDSFDDFNAHCFVQSWNSSLESQADPHRAVKRFPLARSAAFAQRRWTMVFSVLKWFSIWRIVKKKKTC